MSALSSQQREPSFLSPLYPTAVILLKIKPVCFLGISAVLVSRSLQKDQKVYSPHRTMTKGPFASG